MNASRGPTAATLLILQFPTVSRILIFKSGDNSDSHASTKKLLCVVDSESYRDLQAVKIQRTTDDVVFNTITNIYNETPILKAQETSQIRGWREMMRARWLGF